MRYRIISFVMVVAAMCLVVDFGLFSIPGEVSPSLVLGFLLLSAYCMGVFLARLGLPQITGYIFAGLLFGPFFLDYCNRSAINDLGFLNSLALAFIAFCAGGELKLASLRSNLKIILCLIGGVTSVVFTGVTLSVFLLSSYIPFMSSHTGSVRMAISAIFGVISVARSPSSAIAIISETKAKGDYTDTVLGVTVVMDVVIIMLFAVVISVCQMTLSSSSGMDVLFIVYLLMEILIALIFGFLLGKVIVFLIEKVKVEFPVVIAAMGFIVIKFCHFMGEYFYDFHDISVNIEPLLICMFAGFTVQNFSKHGSTFLKRMDRVSLPIYVAFFAITGASINVELLKTFWMLGLIIVVVRTLMIFVGSRISGKIAGDKKGICKNAWLGFITQAGVSLGLLSEVVRRFPEIGGDIQSILIAAITANQIVGPMAFKYALNRAGETEKQRKSDS